MRSSTTWANALPTVPPVAPLGMLVGVTITFCRLTRGAERVVPESVADGADETFPHSATTRYWKGVSSVSPRWTYDVVAPSSVAIRSNPL